MKNIITFYSADNKAGATIICQTAAGMLAKLRPEKKILIAHFDGNPGTDYTGTHQYCLDDIRLQLISDVITLEDILSVCVQKENLYSLKGCQDSLIKKFYQPVNVKKMFDLLKNCFDFIIVDAGCSDTGLTIGSLLYSDANILVATQQKSAHTKFSTTEEQVFRNLSIKFDELVINKFSYSMGTFLPTEKETADMYGFHGEVITVGMSNYAWQAEYERSPLTEYKEKSVIQGVTVLANKLLSLTETVESDARPAKDKKPGFFRKGAKMNAAG